MKIGFVKTILFITLLHFSFLAAGQNRSGFQTLVITSKPNGATVTINKKEVGTTPFQMDLRPGRYLVRVQHPDYFAYEEELAIVEGDDVQMIDVGLQIKPANLIVKTNDDVDVWVDGEWIASGPFKKEVNPGRHKVEFGGNLYELQVQDVRLKPKETKTLEVVPVKRFGKLEVITRPKGAKVFLNDKEVGEAPILLEETRVGRNRLEVYLKGYYSERRAVVVEDIRTTIVKVKLKKLPGIAPNQVAEEDADSLPEIVPLTNKKQERWNRQKEIRDPFSWKYHDIGLGYVRGIAGNGIELAYYNRVGAYLVYTTIPDFSYETIGGGLLIREYVFGKRNRGGVYGFGGFGKSFEFEGFYWEIGQLLNLGNVSFSFGVSQVNINSFGLDIEKEYLPFNDLKVRFGLGFSF